MLLLERGRTSIGACPRFRSRDRPFSCDAWCPSPPGHSRFRRSGAPGRTWAVRSNPDALRRRSCVQRRPVPACGDAAASRDSFLDLLDSARTDALRPSGSLLGLVVRIPQHSIAVPGRNGGRCVVGRHTSRIATDGNCAGHVSPSSRRRLPWIRPGGRPEPQARIAGRIVCQSRDARRLSRDGVSTKCGRARRDENQRQT